VSVALSILHYLCSSYTGVPNKALTAIKLCQKIKTTIPIMTTKLHLFASFGQEIGLVYLSKKVTAVYASYYSS